MCRYCSDFRWVTVSLNKEPELLALSPGSCGAEFHSWADLERAGSLKPAVAGEQRPSWGTWRPRTVLSQ